ncbi:hypothetical protein [Clostridium sp. CH2]|uniref:hypothetical protein n=1 Tax=Clostridium sp. CH2 TaxID=2949990 RepID=UPI00207AB6FC|nr:hypothetical protein [Clostridium sp. CH2]
MSNELDIAKLSDIIQSITQEIVSNTENFIKSVSENSIGTDTVSIMINGKEIILNRNDYNALKAQNDVIRLKMKTDIKTLTEQFKANIKNKAKNKRSELSPDVNS